ncbi:hypothetical protein P9112_009349 [Eukaryota sp. TZLM1-RC]
MLGQSYDVISSSLSCSTCKELMVEPTTLNCGHSHCRCCILQWMQHSASCPVCRQSIGSNHFSIDIALRNMIEILRRSSSTNTGEVSNLATSCQDALPEDMSEPCPSQRSDDMTVSRSDPPTATTELQERISALEARSQELENKLSKALFDQRQDARRNTTFLKKERMRRMHLQGNCNSHQ